MNHFSIERKDAFRMIGFGTRLEGSAGIHSPMFSGQKTAFFKNALDNGQMAGLRPYAESPYGYAAVILREEQPYYYAGVVSSQPAPETAEEIIFPAGDYLILSGSGGLSRLAFDRLEDQAFDKVLTEKSDYAYAATPIAEVLLNGNPADAEAQIWVPVHRRSGKESG